MEHKDNVCENKEAEQVAEAKVEKGSTAFGKFKDANALLEAYESLQAEFTRRSQRLKELERKADNSAKESTGDGESSGAEKLLKNAEKRKAREQAFDTFVSELEGAGRTSDVEPEKEARVEGEELSDGAANADGGFGKNIVYSRPSANESENLYLAASADERVRLRIVGDYLSSIGGANAPLTKSGGGILVSPIKKAKSIHEAGGMALRFFEKGEA